MIDEDLKASEAEYPFETDPLHIFHSLFGRRRDIRLFDYLGRERLLRNFEQNSHDITGLLAETIFDDLYFSNLQALRLRLKSARVNPDVKYTVVTDPKRFIIADGTDKNLRKDERWSMNSASAPSSEGWISEFQENLLRVGGPVLAPDGERRGYLEVGFGLQSTQQVLDEEFRSGILVTGPVCLSAASWRSGSRPISPGPFIRSSTHPARSARETWRLVSHQEAR